MPGDEWADAVIAEWENQQALKESGKFDWTSFDDAPYEHILSVLVEEVGECARAVLMGNEEDLETELLQTAAVALGWREQVKWQRAKDRHPSSR